MHFILRDRREIAEGTMAFWFEPPADFRFKPGQFVEFTLIDPPRRDAKGNTRALSIASSPRDPLILVATRLSPSAFKENLRTAPPGTVVEGLGPMGVLTLHEDPARPAVFLTGGIGITPVRSIVKHATEERLPHRLVVFYSNRTRAASAFLEDFTRWAKENPNLLFVPTLTDEHPADWSGEHGFIDAAMIRRHLPNPTEAIYYIVGPPAMVEAMKKLAQALGVPPERVKSEDFVGY
jgi:ferredoxin-NADP reductase